MPSINGITASIHTHDGPLEEFAVDEFPGGINCIIPAQSGQQFWLNYSIDQSIKAKGVSVVFDVDGNRIDTQFPLALEGSDPPIVGPVSSSITSQYIKDDDDNVYRRDIFFTLAERPKSKTSKKSAVPSSLGTIECKIYRAEKTGEWSGKISADDLNKEAEVTKDISHQARLGANMPAVRTVRYTFKNIDEEETPYAFFRFYYRSMKYLRLRGYATSMDTVFVHSHEAIAASIPVSRATTPVPSGIPRPATRAIVRRSSLYSSLTRGKEFMSGRKTPQSDPLERSKSPSLIKRLTSPPPVGPSRKDTQPVDRPKTPGPGEKQSIEHSDILHNAYQKFGRLRKSSELLKRKDTKGKMPEVTTCIPEEEGLSDKSPRVSTTPAPTPTTPETPKVKLEPSIPLFVVTENEELSVVMPEEADGGDADVFEGDKKESIKVEEERKEVVAGGMKAHAEAESKAEVKKEGSSTFKWLAN